MSTESAERQQQKVREFMSLLPVTLAIAGTLIGLAWSVARAG